MWASYPRFLLLISVPHSTNKILKAFLDLSSFLGNNFNGRPIAFQIHSCRGNIGEKKWGGAKAHPAPPVPPPMP